MTNMLKKVFNWSEVHLSEVTSYKIHALSYVCNNDGDTGLCLGGLHTLSDDGTDLLYRLGNTVLPLGWGPRHMAISKNMAYVIYELKNRVGVFRLNPINGQMVELQTIPTIEDSDIKDGEPEYGAEIQAHPNEKWLYVSNRQRFVPSSGNIKKATVHTPL